MRIVAVILLMFLCYGLTISQIDTIWYNTFANITGWETDSANRTNGSWYIGEIEDAGSMDIYAGNVNDFSDTSENTSFAFVNGIDFLLTANYTETNTWIQYTEPFDFSAETTVFLFFSQVYKGFNGDSAIIELGFDGLHWEHYIYVTNYGHTYDNYGLYVRDVSELAGQSEVYLRFRWHAPETVAGEASYGGGYGWQIDNVGFCRDYISHSADIQQDGINIYPNPTSGILNLEGVEWNVIEIIDLTGKLLLVYTTFLNQIDITSLPKGFYMIKLKTDQGTITRKIVKD